MTCIPENDLWSDMLDAVRADDVEQMQRLLSTGFAIESKDSQGITALAHAFYQQKFGVVAFLLANGANINTADAQGWTPLMWAAYNGRDAALRAALESGADPRRGNHQGETPLFWAVYKGHAGAVGLLLTAGADPAANDLSGVSPLALSAVTRQYELATLLHACAPAKDQRDGFAFEPAG